MTGASSVFATSTIGGSGLNALTFDKLGNAYISNSFDGIIWKVGPNGGIPTVWSNSPLLGPGTGLTPPFGANGVEFNNAGTTMYVANTRSSQYIHAIRLDAAGNMIGRSIFADLNEGSEPGIPDGLKVDSIGRVYCTGSGGI